MLSAKWHIHPMFYVLLLERDVTRKEAINQKIAGQLKFKKRK